MMYLDAVEKQIAINEMYGENQIPDGDYTDFNVLRDTYNVKVSGEAPSEGKITIKDGLVESATLVVNNYNVECTSGRVCEVQSKNTDMKLELVNTSINDTSIIVQYKVTNGNKNTSVKCLYGDTEDNLNQEGTISGDKCIINIAENITDSKTYYYALVLKSKEEEIKREKRNTTITLYKDTILNGTDPVYSSNLIPVNIENNGTVKKAGKYTEWYSYTKEATKSRWPNAVILKESSKNKYNDAAYGAEISLSDIESYFVWIPKYSYKLFNLTNTGFETVSTAPTTSIAHTIDIRFGTTNTSDSNTGECTTPMTSGNTGSCDEGEWMTHPAFISMNTNGLWVAKFETTETTDGISVLPGETSLRSQTVKSMFELAYNYKRNNDSHMMKNTEWGAVAYLSHSLYGINTEVRINNNSDYKTGYSAVTAPTCYGDASCNIYGNTDSITKPYNTSTGYLASTTGNITGIYDMAGGAHEYMAAYIADTYKDSGFDATTISNYNSKYFDIYASDSNTTTYNKMIIGDATGEMGPFYSYADKDVNARYHNNWYADTSYFALSSRPWFCRGGSYYFGVLAGQFYFNRDTGGSFGYFGFRLVLTN